MIGGGFLKQGMDSFKYNRSLTKKEKHTPFSKKKITIAEKRSLSPNDIKISDEAWLNISKENLHNERLDIIKLIAVTIIIIITISVCFYYMG